MRKVIADGGVVDVVGQAGGTDDEGLEGDVHQVLASGV